MAQYPTEKIRNVVFMGHGGSGKTSLAEGILYKLKATDRLGKISEGNTVCDFDPEEIKRKVSVSAAIAPVEFKGCKINIIDTPGYFDFAGEVFEGLAAAEGAVITVTGKSGVEVGSEKAWKYAADRHMPKVIFVTKMDEENADFYKVLDDLRAKFGVSVCPFAVPIINGGKFEGYVNVVNMTARVLKNGKPEDVEVPADMMDKIEPVKNMINESIAETSEELMEKFFDGVEFTEEESDAALKDGVKSGGIVPVVCGCAGSDIGLSYLLNILSKYFPAPGEKGEIACKTPQGEDTAVKCVSTEPTAALIFKTVADPYVGKLSYFKVLAGEVKPDMQLLNTRSGQTEKIGRVFTVRGKKQIETDCVTAGDIGAVTKLASSNTSDTLCSPKKPVVLQRIEFPEPCISLAVVAKAKGEEEKISAGLTRLMEEDPTFKTEVHKETRQQLISGLGDMHLDVISSKLKNKFGVGMDLVEPKVPYRETIRGKVKVEGKHKKQSGGHGQYGHVWIEFEPGETEDLTFAESVFGGAVPRNFFPAVEKGLRDSIKKGVLAGYPVVNLKATLVDGSYHPVDSSEMAFKVAASLAYKNGLPKAKPVLLEPIGNLSVLIPEANMGDIIGDINKRRGRILGMNPDGKGMSEVVAEVPMSEMHSYTIDLRSMTQGRGEFKLAFERYEDAPPNIAQKIIEESKADMDSDE